MSANAFFLCESVWRGSCASSTSNSSPAEDGRGSFFRACSYYGSLRRLAIATGRVKLTLPENANSCSLQLRVIYLCDRFQISRDRIWNLDETAVRMVPAGVEQEGRINPSLRFARHHHGHISCKHEGRHVDTDCLRGKSDPVHPHGPVFPCQLVSHSPTHWITQEALLNMIDAIDAGMHARAGDAEQKPRLLVLDCAPKHIAKEHTR